MTLFCKHTWVKVIEKTLPPPVDTNFWGALDIDKDLVQKTYICILKCSKCGKIDKTVVRG